MATSASTSSNITRLPEASKPSAQRWQQLVTRPKNSPGRSTKGLTVISTKTPKSTRKPLVKPKTPVHSVSASKTCKTPKSTGKKKTPSSCRFLPSRIGNDDYSSYVLLKGECGVEVNKDSDDTDEENENMHGQSLAEYQTSLMSAVCGGDVSRSVLTFKNTTPHQNSIANYSTNSGIGSASVNRSLSRDSQKKKERRKVSSQPEKILDAPTIMNDYYLNTIDWGPSNIVVVALESVVYLWNATENSVDQLTQLQGEDLYVSSVAWADTGKYLAIGVSNGDIQLWDVAKQKKVRTMRGHEDRVSSLHWNSFTLSSGSRTGEVHIHDVRKPQHCMSQLKSHSLEVCGLQWSPDRRHLASGGNDNVVCVWDPSASDTPLQSLSGHTAAVKALAWCPCQHNLLATGGGSSDKTVKFWNTTTGECYQSLNAKSQVSAVKWSKDGRELISSHGEPRNQISIWSYPSLTKVADLKGHQERILSLALSPHKTRVISAGADETLRIWKCYNDQDSSRASKSSIKDDSLSTALLGGMY